MARGEVVPMHGSTLDSECYKVGALYGAARWPLHDMSEMVTLRNVQCSGRPGDYQLVGDLIMGECGEHMAPIRSSSRIEDQGSSSEGRR